MSNRFCRPETGHKSISHPQTIVLTWSTEQDRLTDRSSPVRSHSSWRLGLRESIFESSTLRNYMISFTLCWFYYHSKVTKSDGSLWREEGWFCFFIIFGSSHVLWSPTSILSFNRFVLSLSTVLFLVLFFFFGIL